MSPILLFYFYKIRRCSLHFQFYFIFLLPFLSICLSLPFDVHFGNDEISKILSNQRNKSLSHIVQMFSKSCCPDLVQYSDLIEHVPSKLLNFYVNQVNSSKFFGFDVLNRDTGLLEYYVSIVDLDGFATSSEFVSSIQEWLSSQIFLQNIEFARLFDINRRFSHNEDIQKLSPYVYYKPFFLSPNFDEDRKLASVKLCQKFVHLVQNLIKYKVTEYCRNLVDQKCLYESYFSSTIDNLIEKNSYFTFIVLFASEDSLFSYFGPFPLYKINDVVIRCSSNNQHEPHFIDKRFRPISTENYWLIEKLSDVPKFKEMNLDVNKCFSNITSFHHQFYLSRDPVSADLIKVEEFTESKIVYNPNVYFSFKLVFPRSSPNEKLPCVKDVVKNHNGLIQYELDSNLVVVNNSLCTSSKFIESDYKIVYDIDDEGKTSYIDSSLIILNGIETSSRYSDLNAIARFSVRVYNEIKLHLNQSSAINFGKICNTVLTKDNSLIPIIRFQMLRGKVCLNDADRIDIDRLNFDKYLLYPLVVPSSRYFTEKVVIQRDLYLNECYVVPISDFFFANNVSNKIFNILKNSNSSLAQFDFGPCSLVKRGHDPEASPLLYRILYINLLITFHISQLNKVWSVWKDLKVDEIFMNNLVLDEVYKGRLPHLTLGFLDLHTMTSSIFGAKLIPKKSDSARKSVEKGNVVEVDCIFVFPGSGTPQSWYFNLATTLVDDNLCLSKGKIHKGFRQIFNSYLRKAIDRFVEELRQNIIPSGLYTSDHPYVVVFSGFSQGGSTALLSSLYLDCKLSPEERELVDITLISFGKPLLGDETFENYFIERGFRHYIVAIDADPVVYGDWSEHRNFSNMLNNIIIPMKSAKYFQSLKFNGSIWSSELTVKSEYRVVNLIRRVIPSSSLIELNPVFSHLLSYLCMVSLLTSMFDNRGDPLWSSHCYSPLLEKVENAYSSYDNYLNYITSSLNIKKKL